MNMGAKVPDTERTRRFRDGRIYKNGEALVVTIPKQLESDDLPFPYEKGSELIIELREPENELVIIPKGE